MLNKHKWYLMYVCRNLLNFFFTIAIFFIGFQEVGILKNVSDLNKTSARCQFLTSDRRLNSDVKTTSDLVATSLQRRLDVSF